MKDRLENLSPEVQEGVYDPFAPEQTGPVEGADTYGNEYVPGPGEMAPYQIPQRPLENPQEFEGFDPDSNAEVGTGGLY